MKRAVAAIPLPVARQFETELPGGAVVRSFLFSYIQKQVTIVSAQRPTPAVEEVPTILVEVDPDAVPTTRRFVVAEEAQIVESDGELKYIGSAMSQASKGKIFHLFEEVLPESNLITP